MKGPSQSIPNVGIRKESLILHIFKIMETVILILHFSTTIFMTGVCWFVQVVHYPLFRAIPLELLPGVEKKNFRTAYVTVPVMVVELFSGLYIYFSDYDFIFLWNMILLAVIEVSTVFFQIPLQIQLTKTPSKILISKLIKTNWIRTISWTLRCVLLCILFLS